MVLSFSPSHPYQKVINAAMIKGVRPTPRHERKYLTEYGKHLMRSWRHTHEHMSRPGELGCLLAHRKAWKRCAKRGRPLWIMEDRAAGLDVPRYLALEQEAQRLGMDLVVAHAITSGYPFWCSWAPDRPFCRGPQINKGGDPPCVEPLFQIQSPWFSTKCYRISPKMARTLLADSRFDMQSDGYMAMKALHAGGGLKCAFARNIVATNGSALNEALSLVMNNNRVGYSRMHNGPWPVNLPLLVVVLITSCWITGALVARRLQRSSRLS